MNRPDPRREAVLALLERAADDDRFLPDEARFARLLDRVPPKAAPPAPRRSRALRPAVAAAMAAALIGGTTLVAQPAQPRTPLYPVKRASEAVWLRLALTIATEAAHHIDLAGRRAAEALAAAESGQLPLARQLAGESRAELAVARGLVARIAGTDSARLLLAEADRIETLLAAVPATDPPPAPAPPKRPRPAAPQPEPEPSPAHAPPEEEHHRADEEPARDDHDDAEESHTHDHEDDHDGWDAGHDHEGDHDGEDEAPRRRWH